MRAKTVEDVAKELAAAHVAEDPKTTKVYFIDDGSDEVKLLEVSESLGSYGPVEMLPFRFQPQPDDGIPYVSVVLLLSPSEWQEVNDRDLALPAGWDKSKLKQVI